MAAIRRSAQAPKFRRLCPICGVTGPFGQHLFHPKYPSELEARLRGRGYEGASLIRLIKKYADFSREPDYKLPEEQK